MNDYLSMRKYIDAFKWIISFTLGLVLFSYELGARPHPNLVINNEDVRLMQKALTYNAAFRASFNRKQIEINNKIKQPINVPIPKDAGGGATHEQHKANYQLMYDLGILYQITGDKKYADYVKRMLLEYAELYPRLPIHPKKKSSNQGKLFWQGLNEAVWLVYSIQAFDLIYDSLSDKEVKKIEEGLFIPVATFLSDESPKTFNKIHNHATWSTAGVGMTGFVLGDNELVEKSLYGLNKTGDSGFIKQMDKLFSPQGYYTEGPYYQRYALLPFITFAKAIEVNRPQLKIFERRDGILLKAINTTIQLSYNNLFFPINDAIKNKGLDTPELVYGVALAYWLTDDPTYLDIARAQNQILLTAEGAKVAEGIQGSKDIPFEFRTVLYGDGAEGNEGALVVFRGKDSSSEALVFKATAQGMGHGHFDKLNWLFYDKNVEVVSDYGAARFLNIEAKNGGRYLAENESWAKQTVAHNTLVVDQVSHFKGDVKVAEKHAPEILFFDSQDDIDIVSAKISNAYPDTEFSRTMALIKFQDSADSLVIDVLDVKSQSSHQYDLPVHYQGQIIETNYTASMNSTELRALGKEYGYQHLWNTGSAKLDGTISQTTWLSSNGRFYTHTSLNQPQQEILFTMLGANDPDFNLRNDKSFIYRVKNKKHHTFVGILESHGEYNPAKEFTLNAQSNINELLFGSDENIQYVSFSMSKSKQYLLALSHDSTSNKRHRFKFNQTEYQFNGFYKLFEIKQN